jgi:hypothetical protein
LGAIDVAGNRRKRTEGQSTGKRLNVMMRDESVRRLMINVVMAGRNPGDILSDLIDQHLRSYSMPGDLTANPRKKDRAIAELQAIESEPIAA